MKRMEKWTARVAIAAGILAASAAAAQPTGDPETGHRIATVWCSNCHLIGPPAASTAQDAAPPFAAIARRPATTHAALLSFLQAPHTPMPDFNLTPRQHEDVIAYLLSLRH